MRGGAGSPTLNTRIAPDDFVLNERIPLVVIEE